MPYLISPMVRRKCVGDVYKHTSMVELVKDMLAIGSENMKWFVWEEN